MATARPHDHVTVFLEDDVGAVVKVEHGDGIELGGRAAGLGHKVGVHQVHLGRGERSADGPLPPCSPGPAYTHQGLHNGMVGGVHVRIERESALPVAVVGRVTLGCDDPILRVWTSEPWGGVVCPEQPTVPSPGPPAGCRHRATALGRDPLPGS